MKKLTPRQMNAIRHILNGYPEKESIETITAQSLRNKGIVRWENAIHKWVICGPYAPASWEMTGDVMTANQQNAKILGIS